CFIPSVTPQYHSLNEYLKVDCSEQNQLLQETHLWWIHCKQNGKNCFLGQKNTFLTILPTSNKIMESKGLYFERKNKKAQEERVRGGE
ncbi:unnamed protein product, partial [Caenorhabditis brenneri]